MLVQSIVDRKFNDRELAVRSQLEVWEGQNRRLGKLLFELTDEQLEKHVSPGKNTGLYVLGHLTAVSDRMLPTLGLGDMRFPHLAESFINEPEHADRAPATASEIRRAWADALSVLSDKFARLTPDEWFTHHAEVSDEELDEPHRTKINVLIDGTRHVTHHLGELTLLKSKGGN